MGRAGSASGPRGRDRPSGPEARGGVGDPRSGATTWTFRATTRRRDPVRRRPSSTWSRRSRCSSTSPTPRPRSGDGACPQGHLLVSVPREPLWRGLNIARGAYMRAWATRPGPAQPLVPGVFRAAGAPRQGAQTRSPFPWTMLLVSTAHRSLDRARRPGARRAQPGRPAPGRPAPEQADSAAATPHGRASSRPGRGSCRSGSRRPGSSPSPTWRPPATSSARATRPHLALLGDHVVILSVIYRPIEQLLSRTIADRRARGLRPYAPRPGRSSSPFALVFLVVALALRPGSRTLRRLERTSRTS